MDEKEKQQIKNKILARSRAAEKALSPYAAREKDCLRRSEYKYNFYRRGFVRDCEAVINLAQYNRYGGKTQVFSLHANNDISTRASHVGLVSRIARTIGRALRLNCDLIEAIACAHDLGHAPFGHKGEVWLNADSELRYPARFTGADRRVWLSGEAYFSVRTDSARPFVVEAEDVRVRVYGTEFNVSTQETGRVETVLVSGSVGMGHGGEEVALRPSEKGTFARESGEMTVEEVDVLPYVAWRTGDFVFKDESLERIMDKLARWYDLEVFFQNADLREVRLSGNLKRFKDVRELFRSFEKISEARFTVNGKTVVIGK